METTYIRLGIRKYKESAKVAEDEFFLDTGIAYAVAPEKTLRELGIEPDGEETFFIGMDTAVRKRGDAYFEFDGKGGYSKVLFGQEGDVNLIGFRTLEALGLMLDPFTRELKPLPTLMMTW